MIVYRCQENLSANKELYKKQQRENIYRSDMQQIRAVESMGPFHSVKGSVSFIQSSVGSMESRLFKSSF